MGEYRFRLPKFWQLEKRQASCIHVVGLDGIPWPCRVSLEDDVLVLFRNRDESGKVYIAYPFEEFGEMTICTGTLPERPEPYHLIQELARGTLNRLRNQISIWQEGGLSIATSVTELTAAATRQLGSAIITSDGDKKDEFALEGLRLAMQAVFEVSRNFGGEIASFRVSQAEIAPFWMAATLSNVDQIAVAKEIRAFDLVQSPMSFQNCGEEQHPINSIGKHLIIGPLIDTSAGAYHNQEELLDDFDSRKRNILNECRQALTNCPPTRSLIHAAAGLNGIGNRFLSFPQQMQVVAEIIRLVEDTEMQAPMMVSFDFPWAERLAWSVGGTHPLQIADSLLRQALPIAFLGLEVNLDYWPAGSIARDPLQWIDLADIWAQLGLPLVICVRWPVAGAHPGADMGIDEQNKAINTVRNGMNDEQRLKLLDTILPMLVARPSIHGVLFRQWADGDDKRFPRGGLFAENHPKTILDHLDRIRTEVLERA